MKIVFLDSATVGEDVSLSPNRGFGRTYKMACDFTWSD